MEGGRPGMREESEILKHSQEHFHSLRTAGPRSPQTHSPWTVTPCLYIPLESDLKCPGEEAKTLSQTDYCKRGFYRRVSSVSKKMFT